MAESLLCRSPGHPTWAWIIRGTCALAIGATLLMVWVPQTTKMIVFILLTLWCHGPLSPLLPAAYEPVLLGYGQLFPPVLLAIVGAVSSTATEYLNYRLYRKLLKWDSLDRLLHSASGLRLRKLYRRAPFFSIWLCVWSPLPDWAARVLAAHSEYSVRRYLSAFLLARIPRFWFLAAVGLHWLPNGWALGAITAGVGAVIVLALLRQLAAAPGKLATTSTSESPAGS